MVHIDVGPAIQAIEKNIGALGTRAVKTAVSRALNHTAQKARTAANKRIREVYNIKARDVRKAMKHVRATARHLEARIDVTGAPLPLIAFGARSVKHGVSVAVLQGQRKVIQRAFIQTMSSGHKGIYARGQYQSGRFGFRTKRISPKGNDLPIGELTSVSVPHTIAHAAVMASIAEGIQRDFSSRLNHELSRMAAGIAPSPSISPIY